MDFFGFIRIDMNIDIKKKDIVININIEFCYIKIPCSPFDTVDLSIKILGRTFLASEELK